MRLKILNDFAKWLFGKKLSESYYGGFSIHFISDIKDSLSEKFGLIMYMRYQRHGQEKFQYGGGRKSIWGMNGRYDCNLLLLLDNQ